MSRDAWRKRLLEAELPEEVVDSLLDNLKDEDLVRMKDMSTEEILETLKAAAETMKDADSAEDETAQDEPNTDETPDTSDDTSTQLKDLEDRIVQRVTEQLRSLEIEVEIPQLKELSDSVQAIQDLVSQEAEHIKELREAWAEVLRGETERLKELVSDMSPAQRVRLRAVFSDGQVMERVAQALQQREQAPPTGQTNVFNPPPQTGTAVFRDADGRDYESLRDMTLRGGSGS